MVEWFPFSAQLRSSPSNKISENSMSPDAGDPTIQWLTPKKRTTGPGWKKQDKIAKIQLRDAIFAYFLIVASAGYIYIYMSHIWKTSSQNEKRNRQTCFIALILPWRAFFVHLSPSKAVVCIPESGNMILEEIRKQPPEMHKTLKPL